MTNKKGMPNIGSFPITTMKMKAASELVDILGGVREVSRMLGIRQPSVYDWFKKEVIPSEKIIILAARIECATEKTDDPVTRKDIRPDDWHLIWPELIDATSNKAGYPTDQVEANGH